MLEKAYGPDHEKVTAALNNWAWLLTQQVTTRVHGLRYLTIGFKRAFGRRVTCKRVGGCLGVMWHEKGALRCVSLGTRERGCLPALTLRLGV